MVDQRRRLVTYVGLVIVIVLGYTLLYDWGMATFENRPKGFVHSLGIVVQTFTTTGYGEDAPWLSTQMKLLMVTMQFTGVFMIFLALPLFVAPWVEERLQTTIPTTVSNLQNHVVLCELSSRGEALIDELDSWDREYVVVESDRGRVETLRERGLSVIHGDPESTETLRNASVPTADTLVADASDEVNASIVLAAREVSNDVRIVAFAENPEMGDYLTFAGADEVFTPHHLLGESLANRVRTAITTELGETVEIGTDFELVELAIQDGCPVDGTKLNESGIRERTGANVIGLWRDGDFESPPNPDADLDSDTIMLVAGSESQLESLKRLTVSEDRERERRSVVIAGYGEVGATVKEALANGLVDLTVIDIEDAPGVDVLGDASDADVLTEAGIGSAQTLILTLGEDNVTMLATLVARELNPDIEILARAEEAESIGKVYRAGADYVLALATVSGRMIASVVLDEEVMSPDIQIQVVRTAAPSLVGKSLDGAAIRARTGCTVVAVERDGNVLTDIDPGFVLESDDTLVVAGTDESINRFNEIAQ